MLIEKKRRRRLTLELALMTVLSLIAAFLAMKAAERTALQLMLGKLYRADYYESQASKVLDSLRTFIRDYQVTEDNMELLAVWTQKEENVYAMFYRDVDALFSPYPAMEEEGDPPDSYGGVTYYEVTLADGAPVKVELECYPSKELFYMVDIVSFLTGGTVFVLLLFLLIHRKIRYINLLDQELRILGSGNLEYPMTMRGNDELTGLAEGIESLKNGILEQQFMKDEAEKANAELVTAMSHDLRTPLTSLIGYLELLTMQRYTDEAQMQSYLRHCREKAFQLKRMSDRLFEYFLVYGKKGQQYHFHAVSCENLLEDLCHSQFFDWQEQGGTLDCRVGELRGQILVDSDSLQRVIDNLLSNLKKYADTKEPLTIEAAERQGMLRLCVSNHVKNQERQTESTQIGLRTCRRILEAHRGGFFWQQEGGRFFIQMTLPLF